MKKLLFVAVLFITALSANAQAQKYLNFGLVGVSYEIPLGSAITIAPTAYTNFDLDHLTLGVKSNYYFDELFNLHTDWDVYGGANVGFGLALNDGHSSDLNFGLQAGGRWFWSDKWGVYAEIGGGALGGAAYGVGITMKM